MFDVPYVIEAADGARLTVRGTAADAPSPALLLEVRLPPAASAAWISALEGYRKRFEVLYGGLLLDGAVVPTGERVVVERDRPVTLASDHRQTHFVCDLTPAGDRSALVAALERHLGVPRARPQ
jgi:hypothetical protein